MLTMLIDLVPLGLSLTSDSEAHTHGLLMPILHPLQKLQVYVGAHLKEILDHLAKDLRQDLFPLPFSDDSTRD